MNIDKFDQTYRFKSEVKIFASINPWVYVSVPKLISDQLVCFCNRGLVAIEVRINQTIWHTSLMPMGDGSQFIPLVKKIRVKEKIQLADEISIEFKLKN